MSKAKRPIIDFCKEFYKLKARFPTLVDLAENGITREVIRARFGTKTALMARVEEEIATEFLEAPTEKTIRKLKKAQKKYVIIGVMNNTYIDQELMACLERYAKHNRAEILALPMYYKNPTSLTERNKIEKEYWWDQEFPGHYVTKNMNLGPYLRLIPEHRINVTAMNPLVGLEHLAGKYSAIYANPQFHMKVVPESQDKIPHILHTTGTVCVGDNFSHTNAGGKAKRLAVNGALIVELSNDIFNLRQLEYKEGVICDLDKAYTPEKAMPIKEYGTSAMIWGDIHVEVADKAVVEASKKLAKECNVDSHYLHDILDFSCQSHHNKNNFIMKYMLSKHGKDKVEGAVREVAEFVLDLVEDGAAVKIVDSNHHDHIARWINERDFKHMGPNNAYFYICLMKRLMEEVQLDTEKLSLTNDNVLKHALEIVHEKELEPHFVEFLSRVESHMVKGIELSQHGDVGPNGSRGSITGFAKTNGPLVIGHSHSPGIYRHVYQVGKTAHLGQSYMKGYSSHLNTHCIIYPNGGRAL